MKTTRSRMESPYLAWAKLSSRAPVNLATSAVAPFPTNELPIRLEDLELNAPGGYGWPPLLERIARFTGAATDCIVAAGGTSMGNHLAMAATLDPGDEALVEQPTYEPLLATARYLGAEVRRFERRREDEFRLDPRELERAMTPRTRLVALANLHNPTSAPAAEEDLRACGEIAREAGARVLVDEVYLEAMFERRPRAAFHLGPAFITTSSLTKAYGLGGLRCGWVLAEPEMARRMWRLRDLFDVIAAHPAERLGAIAFDHRERIAARARALLAANRPLMERFLDAHPGLATCRGGRPEFGTVYCLRAPGGDGDGFAAFLRERHQTAVVPGRFFEMPDCFRVGIGGGGENLAEGLKRLGAALEEFPRQQ
ncbi:MAG TPA: pyridoxal phosphate-dependent aminotransferase [Candidatus Acidoferrales bacterium]|nr:pyridoxal phosphate-dependent aminotransferase [Candidatus Acidoferrales bacterium]